MHGPPFHFCPRRRHSSTYCRCPCSCYRLRRRRRPAEVMSFDDERELLLRWRDLMLETDPDVLIGYNIVNFDLPYLLNRAETLKIPQFWTWGRMRNRCGQALGLGTGAGLNAGGLRHGRRGRCRLPVGGSAGRGEALSAPPPCHPPALTRTPAPPAPRPAGSARCATRASPARPTAPTSSRR